MSWQQILRELDLVGNAVFLPSLTCLFIALSWAGTKYSWSDPKIIDKEPHIPHLCETIARVSSALGQVCSSPWQYLHISAFIRVQIRKGESATLPPRIFKQRRVLAGFVSSLCWSSAVTVLEYYMPTYYQTVREYSPAKS